MSDREVVITYAIKEAAGNRGVFKALSQGTADIQSAYARAGDAIVRQAEQYAKQITAAYQNANRTIAGSVSQGLTATIPTAAIPMTAQQQALSRAQANGGTGVSQWEPPILRASTPRQTAKAPDAGGDAERVAAADSERATTQQASRAAQNRERFSAGSRKALQGAVSVAEGAAYVGLAN